MFENCITSSYGGEHGWSTKVETRLAKRTTTCCECHAPIPKGEECEYARGFHLDCGLMAGSWSIHTCMTCARVRVSLVRGSFVYGNLWDMVDYAYCKEPGDREAMLPDSYLRGGR